MRPTTAILSTENLIHNINTIKSMAPRSKMIVMLKANAYGHGIRSTAQRIHDQIDMIGVSSIDEAMILRNINIKSDIMLMEGVFEKDEFLIASAEKFHIVIHHEQQVKWLESIQYLPNLLNIWIKIDTGMGRLGFRMDNAECIEKIVKIYDRLKNNKYVNETIGIMSHFACADEKLHPLNQKQINNFTKICNIFEKKDKIVKSFCNSAGIINFPEHHYDFVRPGLITYGASPMQEVSASDFGLKPVMHLQSRILTIKKIKKGESVGYGACHIFEKDSTIAIIPIGYGDGYSRTFKSGVPVVIRERIFHLVGRVSMDMISVDLNNDETIEIDDDVLLFGEDPTINQIAEFSNCSAWDLLTSIQHRTKFQWTR